MLVVILLRFVCAKMYAHAQKYCRNVDNSHVIICVALNGYLHDCVHVRTHFSIDAGGVVNGTTTDAIMHTSLCILCQLRSPFRCGCLN